MEKTTSNRIKCEKILPNSCTTPIHTLESNSYSRSLSVRQFHIIYCVHCFIIFFVIGYPESFPSVKDLQECLSRTQLKPILAQSLKTTLEARLLHQGATTEDILIAYVSAIRAFSVLDPTGVLLDVACDPIKYYLLFIHFHLPLLAYDVFFIQLFPTGNICDLEEILFGI